jgi:hypothetical protein
LGQHGARSNPVAGDDGRNVNTMKKLLLATATLATLAFAVPASADVIDPLHLSCSTCSIDNGTFTATNTGGPTGIVVDSSPPGASGLLLLKILVPTNEIGSIVDVNITGTSAGVVPLFSATAFGSGSLETYLGISVGGGSAANMFNTFFNSSVTVDAGITGYDVFLFNAGATTLTGSFLTSPTNLNINTLLPAGTWILADIVQFGAVCGGATFCNDITTAPSAGLFVNATSAVPEPATWGMMLLGFVGLGFAFRNRRRMVGFAA